MAPTLNAQWFRKDLVAKVRAPRGGFYSTLPTGTLPPRKGFPPSPGWLAPSAFACRAKTARLLDISRSVE